MFTGILILLAVAFVVLYSLFTLAWGIISNEAGTASGFVKVLAFSALCTLLAAGAIAAAFWWANVL